MKKRCLALLFLVILNSSIHAYGYLPFGFARFFWSFGDIGISFESVGDNFRPYSFMNIGNINWITRFGLGWGFNLFNIEGSDNWRQALILPVEISFSPFGDNPANMFLSLYGRGGWMINYNPDYYGSLSRRSSFFGAMGLRLAWIPRMGEYWSIFTGGFIEYTTRKEIRMGVSVDTSIIVALITMAYGANHRGRYRYRY